MTPYLFTRLRPRRTWKEQSIPTDVKVGQESDDQQGGQPFSVHKLAPTHLESTLLSTEMMIQNYVPSSALFEAILIG